MDQLIEVQRESVRMKIEAQKKFNTFKIAGSPSKITAQKPRLVSEKDSMQLFEAYLDTVNPVQRIEISMRRNTKSELETLNSPNQVRHKILLHE